MDCPDASGTTPAESWLTSHPFGGAAFKVQVFGARAAAKAAADAGSVPDSGWVGVRSSAHAPRVRAPSASTSWMGGERNMGLSWGRIEATAANLHAAVKRISSGPRSGPQVMPDPTAIGPPLPQLETEYS